VLWITYADLKSGVQEFEFEEVETGDRKFFQSGDILLKYFVDTTLIRRLKVKNIIETIDLLIKLVSHKYDQEIKS
jgi:hypothetical protein